MGADETALKDNWGGRALRMRCRTCIYFEDKEGPVEGVGRCRRHAPTLGGWPVILSDDWCGDHKIDETKVM